MSQVSGVVLARRGATYRVRTDGGEVDAVLRGKVKRDDDDKIVAGDIVQLALHATGPATIQGRERRRGVGADRRHGACSTEHPATGITPSPRINPQRYTNRAGLFTA